ncbi:MAG: MFS transporter, partial [Candidatus Hermodarchaeota archaeon]|nr:MFS transporter [Candidatus Hermodarchaeota archaeon]
MNHKTTTLLLAGAAHGLVHLLMLSLPYITVKLLQVTPILPGQEALIVILLNTPSYFIFGLGAIPAGVLCDRIGPTKTIAIGLFLSVCSGVGLFFLWPLGITTIALFFILYSFGAGLYHPAGTTWVSNTFQENRGKALGRHG